MMVEMRKIWYLPLIGGIISLISLIAPTAYLNISQGLLEYNEYSWMWGLVYSELSDYESSTLDFNLNFIDYAPELFVPGLITTILLLASTISNIITANRFRIGRRLFTEVKKKWIISGSFHIISAIIYLVGTEIGFNAYRQRTLGVPISFWEGRIPLGIISPFIGGVLVLAGVLLGMNILKRKDVESPLERVGIKPKVSPIPKISPVIAIPTRKFCPECGHKNVVENSHFCVNCGFALKTK